MLTDILIAPRRYNISESRKFESFLSEHFREPEAESLIQQLYSQHQGDERQGLQPSAWIDDEHNE